MNTATAAISRAEPVPVAIAAAAAEISADGPTSWMAACGPVPTLYQRGSIPSAVMQLYQAKDGSRI